MFVGTGVYAGRPIQRSTLSARVLELLVQHGGIDAGSAVKAEHLRHTALSHVYQLDADRMDEALRRSRHERDTFLCSYNTPIDPQQLQAFEGLLQDQPPESVQLEVLLLG